ncbi:hypothetical protein [Polaribacter aestuariivivens]|uniref:hypothetical protein n=1 Tax=Polaribacter aestuariivivens TaxID=2304626 RepID=UPI003F4946D2
MKKGIILFLIFMTLIIQGCKQECKLGYINLNEIYPKIENLVKADSTYKAQQLQVEHYLVYVNKQLKEKKLNDKALQDLAKKYNDTVSAFKQQVNTAYTAVVHAENNNIQKAIDSISILHKYEFVFSTKNNSILYVKDTTHNLTQQVLKLLVK